MPMKYQGCFNHVSTLGLLWLVTLRVQGLEKVIHWIIQKELVLAINYSYMTVKQWVSHSEFQTE